ncbi:hypothetical protein ACH4FA_38090, partial [Streptomyces sp. NPDC017966]
MTSGQASIGRAAADTGAGEGGVAGGADRAPTAETGFSFTDSSFAGSSYGDDESDVSAVWDSDGEDAASVTSVDTDYSEPERSATAPDVFAALTGDGVPVGGREGVAGPAPGDTGFDAVALPVPSAALSPDLPAGNGSSSPAGFRGAVPSSAASPDVVAGPAGGGVVPVLSSDAPSVQAPSSDGPSVGASPASTPSSNAPAASAVPVVSSLVPPPAQVPSSAEGPVFAALTGGEVLLSTPLPGRDGAGTGGGRAWFSEQDMERRREHYRHLPAVRHQVIWDPVEGREGPLEELEGPEADYTVALHIGPRGVELPLPDGRTGLTDGRGLGRLLR